VLRRARPQIVRGLADWPADGGQPVVVVLDGTTRDAADFGIATFAMDKQGNLSDFVVRVMLEAEAEALLLSFSERAKESLRTAQKSHSPLWRPGLAFGWVTIALVDDACGVWYAAAPFGAD
jgi:hypothetical protein